MITKMKTAQKGFSLIELLVVIAVIGILAAILVPVVGRVRQSAAETAGRAQFSQWRQAFELYRQDYGYYPQFGDNNNDFLVNRGDDDGNRFYESLTGRRADGSGKRLEAGDDGYDAGNTRSASFYTFSEDEVERKGNDVIIRDHFGN